MSKKVKTKWIVAIPEGAKVVVTVGEEVEAGRDLLEIDESNENMINVAGRIGRLGSADKKKLGKMLPGMIISKGQVVFETGGMFSKKVSFPISGEVIKLDEFENLHFKEIISIQRKVSCPVKAKVVKNDGQSLEMEFRAVEYVGRGVNEGKSWGVNGIGYASEITDLSAEDGGKIVLTEKLDRAWLMKAEVIGVMGVVIIDIGGEGKDDKIDFKLPILAVEEKEWKELREHAGEENRAMVNAAGGRLLLVV
jgi:hypothetical protein